MNTQITLPKDAEGKEVSLDTKTLYDKHGNSYDIVKFIYYPNSETIEENWALEYVSGVQQFVSQMYLTQYDSWKKLEEDLDKCIKDNTVCAYYCPTQEVNCAMCAKPNKKCGCTASSVFNDIKERIRKLKGEG